MQTRFVLLAGALCAVPALSFFPRAGISPAAAQGPAAAVVYRCPMHPEVVRDAKGDCPVCGMKLVPAATAPQAGIAVGASARKVLGVVVGTVERRRGVRTLRLPGRVAPDEARVFRIGAGIDGSIRDVAAVTTGTHVRKNQVLGSFWAPNALSVIQLYILNLAGRERLIQRQTEGSVEGEGASLGYANIQQRTMQMENLGVSELQREELARTRRVPDTIQIVSPVDGFVLSRNVSPGFKFERGTELFRIADLRRVWILADVFPQDGREVRPGMRARISGPELDAVLNATVTEVLPQFDAATRTLKVRLEADNKGYALRPDMFVDVRLDVALPEALVVPADALIDSGLRKTVFVEATEGAFEPREVTTGWREGNTVEVTSGLSAGERIVTSGAFFLDSETRMATTATGAAAQRSPAPTPTGHEASGGSAGLSRGDRP